MVHCSSCSFYSLRHHGCFYPEAWHPPAEGSVLPFKVPGDPDIINRDYDCPWYDTEVPVQPIGIAGKLKRLFRPLRIRITK